GLAPAPAGRGPGPAAAAPAGTTSRASLKRRAIEALAGVGRALMARHQHRAFDPGRCDLYHEPNLVPLPSDLPTVTTLHDLSVLLHPEWHPADRVAHFERHFRDGLRRTTHFLAISEFIRQEVIRTLHVPPDRVTTPPMGIRPGLRPRPAGEVAAALRRLGLPPRYLLCVGTVEPRKNLLLLLRAYAALPGELRRRYPLLLVGAWGWNAAAVADYLHAEGRPRGVLHVGYVPDADLAALYSGARALAYPSLYEGFGLPPLEMLACGGAVLASTAGAVAEVVGGHAHLTDAHDLDGWREALRRVLADDDWWRGLRRGAAEAA